MILDVAMRRWIANINSFNSEVQHISGKDNAVAHMILRVWFKDDVAESSEGEVSEDYFTSEHMYQVNMIWEFREEQ